MERITHNDLQCLVNRINEIAGTPKVPWTKTKDGVKANIGCYHLDWAYGGVALEQMVNEGGGVRRISTTGYGTKRELYNWMQAFLCGSSLQS